MHYSLRTLLLLGTVCPPIIAWMWMHREWPLQQEWTPHFTFGVIFTLLYPIAFLVAVAAAWANWPPTGQPKKLGLIATLLAFLVALDSAAFIVPRPDPEVLAQKTSRATGRSVKVSQWVFDIFD
jgi:hypothetical protein